MVRKGTLKRVKGWFRAESSPQSRDASPLPAELSLAPPPSSSKENDRSPHSELEWQKSVPPWVDWKVDDEFLKNLNHWSQEHDNTSVSSVLKKICEKLDVVRATIGAEGFRDLLRLIPDFPFPAGTLVLCLVNILLMGIMIPEVKKTVADFVMEIAQDITRMAEAFGNGRASDDLLLQSWDDLKDMRDLVNGICKWAREVIMQRIPLKSYTEKTLQEFKQKNDKARNAFMALGTIRTLRALSDQQRKLDEILESRAMNERMEFIKTTLQNYIAPNATYGLQHKDECHELTRDRWLTRLDAWLSCPSKTERCWWITGQPGVGKSAIALTAAECLDGKRPISAISSSSRGPTPDSNIIRPTLYAQFFINHTLLDTANPDHIFPTIAIQLASMSSAAAVIIHDILKADKTIGNKISVKQIQALFFKPLSVIAEHEPGTIVGLFDGIDELANTDDATLSTFSTMFVSALSGLPHNVKILVFSRPETSIMHSITNITSILRSDLLTDESRDDVKQFLSAKLQEIAKLYRLSNWPQQEQVELLNEYAAGHLGWASLAVRWIGREVQREGDTAYTREHVFGDVKDVRKGDLYDLYKFILGRVIPKDAPKAYADGCRAALGLLSIMYKPQRIKVVITLLHLEEKFNVLHFFRRISSLITTGFDVVTDETIPLPHKSFIDYIVSSQCDSRFRIEKAEHHRSLAITCFGILQSSLHFNMASSVTSFPIVPIYCPLNIPKPLLPDNSTPNSQDRHNERDDSIIYASVALIFHIDGCSIAPDIIACCFGFLKNRLLFWLETLNIIKARTSIAIGDVTSRLSHKFKHVDPELAVLFKSAEDFLYSEWDKSCEDCTSQTYLSLLPFTLTPLASHYQKSYPCLLKVTPPDTDFTFPTSRVYHADVADVYVAAIVRDDYLYFLKVFDIDEGGENIFTTSLELQDLYIPAIAIFSDIVAMADNECRVWNFKTGTLSCVIPSPCEGVLIRSLAISPVSSHIILGLTNGDIHQYDMSAAKVAFCQFKTDQSDKIVSLMYSECGSRVISGDCKGCITIWEVDGRPAASFFVEAILQGGSNISTYSFSPCLRWASCVAGGAFARLDRITGETTMTKSALNILAPYYGNTRYIAISFDGRLVAHTPGGPLFVIWDTTINQLIFSSVGHADRVTALAFIGNSYSLMSASLDGTIRLWDIDSLLNGSRSGMDTFGLGFRVENSPEGPSAYFTDTSWVTGANGECLFCYPRQIPFRNPRNTLVIGECCELDMTRFVYGTEWIKCREPIVEDVQEEHTSFRSAL